MSRKTLLPWGKNLAKRASAAKVSRTRQGTATPDKSLFSMDYPPNKPALWPIEGKVRANPNNPTVAEANDARAILDNAYARAGYVDEAPYVKLAEPEPEPEPEPNPSKPVAPQGDTAAPEPAPTQTVTEPPAPPEPKPAPEPPAPPAGTLVVDLYGDSFIRLQVPPTIPTDFNVELATTAGPNGALFASLDDIADSGAVWADFSGSIGHVKLSGSDVLGSTLKQWITEGTVLTAHRDDTDAAHPALAIDSAVAPAHDPVDDVQVEPPQPALVVEAIVGKKVTLVWTNYPPEADVTYLLEVQNTSLPVPLPISVYDGPMHTVNLTLEPGTWEAWVTARSTHFPSWSLAKSDPVTFTVTA